MLYGTSGACVGCAYSSASLYFASARKLAKDSDFTFYQPSTAIDSITLNPQQVAHSIPDSKGNPIEGLAYFNPGDDYLFYDVQMSVPAAQHKLATAVLNQFLIRKNASGR